MKTLYGNQLDQDTKRAVLACFVHRMTTENITNHPTYANYQFANGYRMPIISDIEWLACTEFYVKKDGSLDGRYNYCHYHKSVPSTQSF